MSNTEEKLILWLFKTNAVRVCPQDKPFWYTSGNIGPYYINTHFLYGSEEKANNLLKIIDKEKENILSCPSVILSLVKENYISDPIYRGLIDEMCRSIKENIDLDEVDSISGGERRDWFFSLLISDLLEKPHITIYKDLKAVISEGKDVEEASNLNGKKVLHIADLITKASSYERSWIPAIKDRGGEIKWSVVVVDRKQGGSELLERENIRPFSMISIDKGFFDKALSMGIINESQHKMVVEYIENPFESMREFVKKNPEFLENSLKADERTQKRARLCIDKNIYNL